MTIRSIVDIARVRDARTPRTGGQPPPAPTVAAASAPADAVLDKGRTTLEGAVPTDVVALYTTMLGVLAGILGSDSKNTYVPLRWGMYAGSIIATILAIWVAYWAANRGGNAPRKIPFVEIAVAAVAFAIWGLVIPESALYFVLQAPLLPIVVALLTAAGVFLLTAVAQPILGGKAGDRD